MSFDRRTFLIGAGSGLTLLALSACTVVQPSPTRTPTATPSGGVRPAGMVRSNWGNDQLAHGSLSFVYIGASEQQRSALAAPIDNRVFFAGEATSLENGGTVQGALESGERAAAEVATIALPGERVTIVGAGAAGAAAARKLTTLGFEVTVIDARDRTGGRIHTAISDAWPVPVEFGAILVKGEVADPGVATAALGAVETRDASGSVVAGVSSVDNLYGIDPTAGSVVTGRYASLVTDLLGDTQVYLSTTVVGIAHDDDSVSVRLGTGESLTAERVIVTVPLGVLKQGAIEFSPELPDEHQTAIDALGMGTVDTVWLRFDEPFWTTDATAWRLTESESDLTTWINLQPLTGEPVLVALVGGDAAERVAAMSDDAVIAAAIEALTPFAA